MSTSQETRLPPVWVLTTLGELCQKPEYGWTTSAVRDAGHLKLLRTTDISKGFIDWSSVPYCAEAPTEVEHYRLRAGDIVISRAGSVGLSALIGECPPVVFASYLIRFRPAALVDARYLLYALSSPDYWRQIRNNAAGIALQNVNAKKLSAVSLPLPPTGEQRRIVAEVEKQFTRLDAAVAALKRVQANLKRYRAAVLKAACEGRLVPTEAELARAEGRDYEPADRLLARILQERRATWEAEQFAKMKANAKAAKNNTWKINYKEPHSPDETALSNAPLGWCWATTEQISARVQYGTSAKTTEEASGVAVLRMGNVTTDGRLDLNELKYLPPDHSEFPELLLECGDLLFNRTNSSDLVGKSAVYLGAPNPCSFASYLIRVRTVTGCNPLYLAYCLNSALGRSWIKSVVSQQVGQANVNGTKLQAFPFPLPPLNEQDRIVAEAERRLSLVEELETAAQLNLKRAERLRQAILERAFEGKLVAQDPNDEPAGVLLQRIRAERAQIEAQRPKQRKEGIARTSRAAAALAVALGGHHFPGEG